MLSRQVFREGRPAGLVSWDRLLGSKLAVELFVPLVVLHLLVVNEYMCRFRYSGGVESLWCDERLRIANVLLLYRLLRPPFHKLSNVCLGLLV